MDVLLRNFSSTIRSPINSPASPNNPNTSPLMRNWDFDVWKHSNEQLRAALWSTLTEFNVPNQFGIPRSTFDQFVFAVEKTSYKRNNPYHNFYHFCDVTLTSYALLKFGGAKDLLTPIEIAALLIASFVHDLDHPGQNGSFQIACSSELAQLYDCQSVLEKHHCAETFLLLAKQETDLFPNLDHEVRLKLCCLIRSCILATDMGVHGSFMTRWEQTREVFDKTNEDHRLLLTQMLLKAADISNPTKRFETARQWAVRVQEEFFKQGDTEAMLNIPISPYMDRCHPQLPNMQTTFISLFVQPVYNSLSIALPSMRPLLARLSTNYKSWATLAETEQKDQNVQCK